MHCRDRGETASTRPILHSMNTSFLRRLSVRKYHLQTFANMGHSAIDRWRLARVGWGLIDVSGEGGKAISGDWSARLKVLGGREVHLCPNDICHLGIFEEAMIHGAYDLALIPFEPDLIIDVGAHIGLFSLQAATRWPQSPILAFEPHPENAVWARRNFASNGIRATLIEAAASLKPGWMDFDLGGGMGRLCAGGSIKVMSVDLPAMLSAFPSSKILLKMDIEGGEMDILPKVLSILPASNAVFVELHGTSTEYDEMLAVIDSLGFTIRVLHDKWSQDGKQRYVDIFLLPKVGVAGA